MAEMNGDEFSSDRTVDILGDDAPEFDFKAPTTEGEKERILTLENENRQLVYKNDVIERRIGELKQSIEDANNEKEKLVTELQESKSEIKTLGSVAERAAQLEGEVFRLQHELISTTSSFEEVSSELADVKLALDGFKKRESDKGRELEAVVAERDLLMEKLGDLEVKENQYLSEMNEKEKEIDRLRAKVEELTVVVGKSGDEKKDIDKLKTEFEARVCDLEKKLEDKEGVINGFEKKERETILVQGKARGLMSREINVGLPMIAGSVVCAVGFCGLVFYLKQAKRT